MYARDVVRALLVQVLEGPPAHAADRGAGGPGRPRRGRGRGRRRRRPRGRLQDGVALASQRRSSPYQGAATGVGGIVRDIISMGARPVALLDPLRFGPLDDERNRWLLERRGRRDRRLRQLHRRPDRRRRGPLRRAALRRTRRVNVMCVGIAPADRLITSARDGARGIAAGAVRRATGRDGIGGVSVLASAHARGGRDELAAVRADRRPVRREAPDRGVPRDDRAGLLRGPAGPRRRRDHLRGQRVGRARRHRCRARPGRGPAARARDGAVRDPHLRVAGADARDRLARASSRTSAPCARSGAWRRR